MQQKGMTLVSVLVAVALTAALAVASSRLISNQVKINKIMDLTDQRDMIARFYTALMHNRVVWRCTLYDPSNSSLLACISDTASCGVGHVRLKTPDCKFKAASGTSPSSHEGLEELRPLTGTHGVGDHYPASGTFFTTNPTVLGESITEHDNNGWWATRLSAASVAKGSIDLVLTITFDRDKYKSRHAGFEPPDIRDTLTYRVRHGDPNVQGREEDCANTAVITVDDLATGLRGITCSDAKLVDVQDNNARPVIHKGQFLHALADGSDARVGNGGTGTQDRTGLKVEDIFPHAIQDINTHGDSIRVEVNSKDGVLGFEPKQEPCPAAKNDPVLAEITSTGEPKWDNQRGPRGAQGLPGPPGYWGLDGCQGRPSPPCPSPQPSCLSVSTTSHCGAPPPTTPPGHGVSCPVW